MKTPLSTAPSTIVLPEIITYAFCMKRFIIPIFAFALLFSGCQVTEDLTLNDDGTGSSYTDIHVEQFFIDVLEDFAEFLPTEDESMMESAINGYASQLGTTAAIKEASWESLGDNRYTVSFDYSSIDTLLSEMGADNQSLFTISDNSLSFYLDINNYPELKAIVPFLSDQNFEVYGPEYNQGMSETDYLDMIYFLLGEDGPEAISNGLIDVNITVPGTVTEADGCTIVDDNTVRFSFPIIHFLLLNEPLSFSVAWN